MATATGPLTTLHRPGGLLALAVAAVKFYKGAAAGVVVGTGYATPLLPGTITHQFVGVFTETYDNSAGTAGGYFTQIERKGCFAFSQTGTTITAAHTTLPVYFADDNTVTLTEGTAAAGVIASVDAAGNVWVDIENAVREPSDTGGSVGRDFIVLSGSADAVNPHISAQYVVTTAGVDSITLAAPTSGTDDGVEITIASTTANAHTITSTAAMQHGLSGTATATFGATAGANLKLKAYGGKWIAVGFSSCTFS